jgi:hypothetical protein
MKKVFMLLTIAAIAVTSANAQKKSGSSSASIGVELGIPTGDLSTSQGIGFGFSGKYSYAIADASELTASLGYISFAGKTFNYGGINAKSPAWNTVPFKAGFRQSINAIYLEPQIGITFCSNTGFTYALGGGYKFNDNYDLGLRYESSSIGAGTNSFIGFRFAYSFGIKN